MHRFYCPNANFKANPIVITSTTEIHHLKDVLRLKKGAKVSLFDGAGQEADGIIQSLTPLKIQVQIIATRTDPQKTLSLILACAIPKNVKFETIIEKCTEIGIDHIVPLKTQRTEIHLDGKRLEQKINRYHTVAINAAKQSQQASLPVIHPLSPLQGVLRDFLTPETLALVFCLEGNRISLFEALQKKKSSQKRILFFIGPEGDFTPQETNAALSAGCLAVSLGKNVLKVDTAAIAVTAIIRQFFSNHCA